MHVRGEIFVPVLAVFIFMGKVIGQEEEIVIKPLQRRPLTCYRCYEYEDHCLTLANLTNIEIAECEPEEIYCKVQRTEKREEMKSFERSCSKYCTPGCETLMLNTRCTSCCDADKCNIGSDAWVPGSSVILLAVAGLATVMFGRI